jgi:hypothetical protein
MTATRQNTEEALALEFGTTLGLILLVLGTAWWNLIHMPGRSYRGRLPAPLKMAVVSMPPQGGK